MYQNYLFDLYGTLIDTNTNERKAYLWEKLSEFYGFYNAAYTPKELKNRYETLVKEAFAEPSDYTCKEIVLENIFLTLYQEKGVKADMALAIHTGQFFRILSTKYIRLYDGVIDLLTSLKKAGKKIYVLSNAQQIFTEYEMVYLGIHDLFDGIVLSSDEGCMKPNQAFYQTIFDRYHLKKSESIMIGNDYRSDINGAHDFGIDSFYIDSNLSPKIEGPLNSTYVSMKMDLKYVKETILKSM